MASSEAPRIVMPASIEMIAPMTIRPGSIPESRELPLLGQATMTAVAAAIAPPTHCWKNTETRRLAKPHLGAMDTPGNDQREQTDDPPRPQT